MTYPMPIRRPLGAYPMRRSTPRRRLRGLPRSMRGLRGLGATASTVTPQEALQQAMQGVANLNPAQFQSTAWQSQVYSMIQNGQFTTPQTDTCQGVYKTNPAAKDMSLTQAVGSIAGAGTAAAGAALTPSAAAIAAGASTAASVALAGVTLGIGLVVAVLSIIFAHHAQAVAQEQSLECAATAGANNAMNVLAEGVAGGQIKPADAITALNTVYSQYKNLVAPSWGTSPWCNANCELEIIMHAMVIYWQAQYQAMADAATAAAANPASGAVQSVAASTGLPSWVILLGGAFLVYELVS